MIVDFQTDIRLMFELDYSLGWRLLFRSLLVRFGLVMVFDCWRRRQAVRVLMTIERLFVAQASMVELDYSIGWGLLFRSLLVGFGLVMVFDCCRRRQAVRAW